MVERKLKQGYRNTNVKVLIGKTRNGREKNYLRLSRVSLLPKLTLMAVLWLMDVMKPKSTNIHIWPIRRNQNESVSQSELEGRHEIGVKCGKTCIPCQARENAQYSSHDLFGYCSWLVNNSTCLFWLDKARCTTNHETEAGLQNKNFSVGFLRSSAVLLKAR